MSCAVKLNWVAMNTTASTLLDSEKFVSRADHSTICRSDNLNSVRWARPAENVIGYHDAIHSVVIESTNPKAPFGRPLTNVVECISVDKGVLIDILWGENIQWAGECIILERNVQRCGRA